MTTVELYGRARPTYRPSSAARPKARYARIIEGLEFHTPEQYRSLLDDAGFTGVERMPAYLWSGVLRGSTRRNRREERELNGAGPETTFKLKAIGVIRTPFKDKKEIPCQGYRAEAVGEVEVFPEFEEALRDIEGFSHVYLIYYFHRSTGYEPLVKPFLDEREHGVFATRYFNRPNPIGISVVRLIGVERNVLKVAQVDMLDGTPLLDIKPYVPGFDHRENVRVGWLEGRMDTRQSERHGPVRSKGAGACEPDKECS